MAEKVESLFGIFEEGVRSLFKNRKQRLKRQHKLFEGFDDKPFIVDQSEMHFVP